MMSAAGGFCQRISEHVLGFWRMTMNRIAARLLMMGAVATCLDNVSGLAAANKTDPTLVWPKNSKFSCSGVLTQEQGTYRLTPDQGMLVWCDADIGDKDKGRLLDACKLGDRCEIKGTIMGHGAFGWVEITSVRKLATHAEGAPDSYSLEAPAYYYNKAIETCPTTVRGYDTACLKKLLDKADQDLDAVYKGRFSYLPKSEFAGLRTAQQAWASSRETNCSWLGHGRQTDIYYLCMLEGSINRHHWLLRNVGD
jgi:uncharacterized protein YecT (DUF1311 family)